MIEFQNVDFQYESGSGNQGIHDINLKIESGQVVVLCGESGCGKTTLTRLVNGLIPHYYEGTLKGDVLIDGMNISEQPLYAATPKVGSVFQNPRSQFFTVDTDSELAFASENMGIEKQEILQSVVDTVEEFKISSLMNRSIFALSGGEKQKIACASVSAHSPEVMVLDEPSSNLDMASIQDLSVIIARWKAEGKTILAAEHRLYYLMHLVDRVIYMRDGFIEKDMTAAEFRKLSREQVSELGLRSLDCVKFSDMQKPPLNPAKWKLTNFDFAYKKQRVLYIPELEIPKNAVIGVLGNNGAGKSTFSRCLCGLERKCKGHCDSMGYKDLLKESYMVMQDVNHQLFTESVLDEIALSMERKKKNDTEWKIEQVLSGLNLGKVKDRHPLSLSGGQKQRVAIGSAIASNKKILIFDEPTSGLDYRHMLEVAESLKKLCSSGKTVFVITHDPELVSRCCNYFLFLENGKVKWAGDYSSVRKKLDHFFEIEVDNEGC